MRISVIASLIVAVHLGVVVMVMAPGCTTVKRTPPQEPAQPADYIPPPDIPVMPPTIDETAVVPPAAVLPPVVAPVDVPEKPASDNVYVVKNGDSLSKIAARHGVKTADIASLNGIVDANKIQVGQKLLLPAYATASQSKPEAAAPAKVAAPETTKNASGQTVYEVKNGDALSKIAKRFGVKQSAIMEANGLKDANKIRIGQKLTIPAAGEAAPAPAPAAPAAEAPAAPAKAEEPVPAVEAPATPAAPAAPATPDPALENAIPFVVSEGDTIDSIAAVFTIDKASLLRANNLLPGATLTPGQTILIPPSP